MEITHEQRGIPKQQPALLFFLLRGWGHSGRDSFLAGENLWHSPFQKQKGRWGAKHSPPPGRLRDVESRGPKLSSWIATAGAKYCIQELHNTAVGKNILEKSKQVQWNLKRQIEVRLDHDCSLGTPSHIATAFDNSMNDIGVAVRILFRNDQPVGRFGIGS